MEMTQSKMSGREAIIKLLLGKKVRRSIWNDNQYWYLKDNKLCNQDNIIFNMTFNELIIGDDWEIFSHYFDSTQAMNVLRLGSKIGNINWPLSRFIYMLDSTIYDQDDKETVFSFKNINDKEWFLLEDVNAL